jgi:hypothetical protein
VYPPSSLRYRVTVTIAVLVAIAALVVAVRSTKSTDESPVVVNGRPDVVEHVLPRDGVEALQQSEIGIDLATGYEGGLSLNGIPIPTTELRIEPAQNQVFFAPGSGRTFEALPSGKNCVTATVWKSSDGPGTPADLSFQWCFDVL